MVVGGGCGGFGKESPPQKLILYPYTITLHDVVGKVRGGGKRGGFGGGGVKEPSPSNKPAYKQEQFQ